MNVRICWLAVLLVVVSTDARAARFSYEVVSDGDDGQLVDGTTWDWKPTESALPDLLLNLGREGSSTYDDALAFHLPDLSEGQTVGSGYLRVNEQGGVLSGTLTVRITGARTLDPLAAGGATRFALPRTTSSVLWTIDAAWDSSGQRIAKYAQTPDLAPILNELLAQTGWNAGPRDAVLFLEVESALGDAVVRYDDTHGRYWNGGNAGIRPARLIVNETFRDGFRGKALLCRPEPTSMTVNFIPHEATEAFVEWGTDGASFPGSSGSVVVPADSAHEFTMAGLLPDTEYHYRLNVRPAGGGSFDPGPTRSFLTLPVDGEQARICVTSDIHVTNQLAFDLTTQMDLLETTLATMRDYLAPQRYHFWLDLGDLVVIRAQRVVFDEEETEQRYLTAREYVDEVGHSLPFVLVRGNHEEITGWDYDGSPENNTIWSGKMLLKYFPPPLPDSFFAGNTEPYPDLGVPGDYFAFDVGRLRIRALDPFLFSETRPHNGHEETGGSLDGWDWTIGQAQCDWLYDDLANHPTPFSLLAIHHLTSCYAMPAFYYGRGGVEVAKYRVDGRASFEWGGEDSTGTNVLATKRPGFLHGALHDMLVASGNQVLIKGHDHFHARQALDGMVYVTLAKPDATEEQTGDLWGWRNSAFYTEAESVLLENSGFYSIVVGDTLAAYSYVQTYPEAGRGTVRDRFTVVSGPIDNEPPAAGKTWIETVKPNPARAPRIQWQLARSGSVQLGIHDASGRLVRRLVSGSREAGPHETPWDGLDGNGHPVASGVYFARLEADGRLDAIKMVLVR